MLGFCIIEYYRNVLLKVVEERYWGTFSDICRILVNTVVHILQSQLVFHWKEDLVMQPLCLLPLNNKPYNMNLIWEHSWRCRVPKRLSLRRYKWRQETVIIILSLLSDIITSTERRNSPPHYLKPLHFENAYQKIFVYWTTAFYNFGNSSCRRHPKQPRKIPGTRWLT